MRLLKLICMLLAFVVNYTDFSLSIQCFYLPYTKFMLNGNSSHLSSFCNRSLLSSQKILQWNRNLRIVTTYLQLKHCMRLIKGTQIIELNNTCKIDIQQRLEPLLDNPLCCDASENFDEHGCYYDILNPCLAVGEENSVASIICKKQLSWYIERKECVIQNITQLSVNCIDWNNEVLPINYFVAGCYSKSSELTNMAGASSYNKDTINFLARSFCSKTASRNCCGNSLCNSPPPATTSPGKLTLDSVNITELALSSGLLSSRRAEASAGVSAGTLSQITVGGIVSAIVIFFVLGCAGLVLGCVCRNHRRHYRGNIGACGLLNQAKQRLLACFRIQQHSQAALTMIGQSEVLPLTEGPDIESRLLRGSHQQEHRRSPAVSSSGSGYPNLVRRTIARETTILGSIGQGRFGQVFKGTWRTGDLVAVKMFHSRAESSWSREGEIYSTPGLQHPAILGFVAMDNLDAGWETQLWLITDYHANGSLQSYLSEQTVSPLVAARICHSVASGLAHLHSELLTAGYRKPGIAHCDVKSNNVLVKADLTCCLADFGLAVRQTDELVLESDRRVGTVRYLSPELLDGSIPTGSFDALKRADVYALALILWEVGTRCFQEPRQLPEPPQYSLPYSGSVAANPGIEEMRRVVCPPASVRPPIPADIWLAASPVTAALASGLLADCWNDEPASRPEAIALKQRTFELLGRLA